MPLQTQQKASPKKRSIDKVITVEDEATPVKHNLGENYRSSVEMLKSCGIDGKELEKALLKKFKTLCWIQWEDRVTFENRLENGGDIKSPFSSMTGQNDLK